MKDLQHKYKIIGMDKKQVLELLGDKNMLIKNQEGYQVYYYTIGQNLKTTNYFKIYLKDNLVVNTTS